MPPLRTPNQCCINNAIEELSFDPTLQDLAWQKAQARMKPYQVERCTRRSGTGENVCEFEVADVLHDLGIGMDPLLKTVATARQPVQSDRANEAASGAVSARRWAFAEISNFPLTQGRNHNLSHLAHKNLLLVLPNSSKVQTKAPTSCSDYLKRYPKANRIQLLAELAACLQYLHTNKIVHGSIRPDALFVDDEGFALLQLSPDDPVSSKPPASFIAPEARGSHEDSTPSIASDIYSFGSIIHWVCTGQEPKEHARSHSSKEDVPRPASPQGSALGQPAALSASLRSNLNAAIDLSQNLSEWTDEALKKLVRQCRDGVPSKRPPMISVVLALQQIKARHMIPALQIHLSAPLTAPLSTYLPRRLIASTPNTPNMRVRPRTLSTVSTQATVSLTDLHRQSPRPRLMAPLLHENDLSANIHYRFPPPNQSRRPDIRVDDDYWEGPRIEELLQSTPHRQPIVARDRLPEPVYQYPQESPSLRPWDRLPPLPSTARLQPPLNQWSPDQGANINRNRTL